MQISTFNNHRQKKHLHYEDIRCKWRLLGRTLAAVISQVVRVFLKCRLKGGRGECPNTGHIEGGKRNGVVQTRDVQEWLSTLPFPPIPTYSIPILSHPHSQVCVLFPFPWDSHVGYSHSHTVNATVVSK